jgi:polysaccharide export outer membrane protein
MKNTALITCLAVSAFTTICLATPQAASDGDKKPAATAPSAQQEEYRIGAGDKLRIEVYKDPQLSQSVQVRPDGKITLPLVGDMPATGRTPLELRDAIAQSLKEYITNPTVTVIVVEALASKVFVMGEVSKPGPVELHGPTTIVQALSMAGGFKEFANTKDIVVMRENGSQVHFNYKDLLNGEAKPIYLKAGDTVIVK